MRQGTPRFFVTGHARVALLLVLGLLATCCVRPAPAGTLVTIDTNFGDIQVDLFNDVTPTTVTNFVNLVTGGTYTDTIIHRSVSNFVIQGGGFKSNFSSAPNNGNIALEYKILNARGTIAMARSNEANSANSQWFINTANNSISLAPRADDPATTDINEFSDGYAAFGWVVSGMDVVDAIAAVPKFNFGSPFNELPLQNYTFGNQVQNANKVIVNSITIADEHPSYQNPIWNVDVNNDGDVASSDMMSIVNSILANGRRFAANGSKIGNTYKYFDPTGDGFVSTADLFEVVNAILRGDTAPALPLASAMAAPEVAPLVVPEPSSVVLGVCGGAALLGLAVRRRQIRRRAG